MMNETFAHMTKKEIESKFEANIVQRYENYCEYHNIDDVDYDYYGDDFKLDNKFDEIEYYLIKLYDLIHENNIIDVQKLTKELIEEKDKKFIEFTVNENFYSTKNDYKLDLLLYNKVSYNWFWFEVSTSTPIINNNIISDRVVKGSYKITSIDYFEID